MKNSIYIFGIAICMLAGISSCDTDKLHEADDPKYSVTDDNVDLGMIFSNIEVQYTRRSALSAIRIPAGNTKYYATHSTIMPGDRYQYYESYSNDAWDPYTNEGKWAIHLISLLEAKNDPAMSNNIAVLKILKGAIFSWVTDVYGDVPYSEAGLALLEGNWYPKFDTQESIYKSILPMLDEACSALDDNKSMWKSYDVIYKGDVKKWRKFGYSVMLRMAMRMSNVDAATAKTYAEKAIAGGVILANADNFQIACQDGQTSERNPVTIGMINNDPEKYWKLGADFVDALKDQDPRAKIIFGGKLKSTYTGFKTGDMNTFWSNDDAWVYDIDQQQGYPHGQSVQVTSYENIQKNYTKQSRFIFSYNSPVIRLGAYEMYFCMTRAAELGWNTGGKTAAELYDAGVTANMTMYDQFASNPKITDPKITTAEIAAYLAYRPYSPDNLLRELWIGNYLDPFQGWFYLRQWGPDLTPNIAGMTMPRRYAYIASEGTRNPDNYNKALQQMNMPLDVSFQNQQFYRTWWDVRP